MTGRAGFGDEEPGHLCLPSGVDVGRGHRVERGLIVLVLEVTDEQPLVRQEDRVVALAGGGHRGPPLRLDVFVPFAVFVQPVRPDAREKADALHDRSPCSGGCGR